MVVTAYAPTLQEALDAVYAGVDKVSFEGKTYRRDIAHRCALPVLWVPHKLTAEYQGS